jgi:hypothetical protein
VYGKQANKRAACFLGMCGRFPSILRPKYCGKCCLLSTITGQYFFHSRRPKPKLKFYSSHPQHTTKLSKKYKHYTRLLYGVCHGERHKVYQLFPQLAEGSVPTLVGKVGVVNGAVTHPTELATPWSEALSDMNPTLPATSFHASTLLCSFDIDDGGDMFLRNVG